MRVGDYEIHSIESGNFRLDGGAMFGVVPKVLWERTNPSDPKNRIDLGLRLLVVKGVAGTVKGRVVVVDCGIGQKWDAKSTEIYHIDHSQHDLQRGLATIGLKASDVTDVLVSHLHFDHVGGALDWTAEGKCQVAFAKAQYYVQEENLRHAHSPTEKDRASFIEHTIKPLEDTGKLKALPGPSEILPGIELLITHGHTPGQQLVKVRGPEATVLFCGDTIATSSHVPVPYVMGYDLYPVTVMQEKKKILQQAIEENWILAWSHDPYVAANRVSYADGKFKKGESIAL